MKKFKFRLQRVLEHRETVRREKKHELFLKNKQLYEAEIRMREIEKEMLRTDSYEDIAGAESYFLTGMYGFRLKEEMAGQLKLIAEAQEAASIARDAFIEASKEAKILESLKEKKLKEYKQVLQHEEYKELDELSIRKGNTMTATTGGE
jgi:flagellar FliJ protein